MVSPPVMLLALVGAARRRDRVTLLCLLFTAGTSAPGTAALAEEILGVEARVGMPMGLAGGLVQEVSDPKYATAVGLVLYGLRPELIGGKPFDGDMGHRVFHEAVPGESLVGKLAGRMRSWFDEL